MKAIFSFLYLCLVSLALYAQPSNSLGTSDPDAKKLLDGVSAKFKTFKTVQAGFSLRIENGSGKVMGNKSGNVMMKGNKYKVALTGQEIFSDGSNVWTYDQEDNEVTISKIDPSSKTMTPQKLFSNFYDKDFLYKLNGKASVEGKPVQEIELTPTDKTKSFFKILLYVDKQSIVSTKVFEKNGNRYVYSVKNLQTDKPLLDNVFLFDAKKYPGVEIVDLR
jgi:outer membrane lipoprotein-sorting protein